MNSLLKSSAFSVIAALTMTMSVLSSCKSTEEEKAYLTVSDESVPISPVGGNVTVAVDTNTDDWTFVISGGSGWLTGEKIAEGVRLTATANDLPAGARTAILTVASVKANVNKPVTVTQGSSYTPYLTVDKTPVEIPADGGEATVEVDTNTDDWTFAITDGDGDGWLIGLKVADGVKLTAVKNPTFDDRTATLTISSVRADVSEEVVVTQMASIPALEFGEPSITGKLIRGTSLVDVNLVIPYVLAVGDESFTVTVQATGAAAAGISFAAEHQVSITTPGAGDITIPLTGMPTVTGPVTFNFTTTYPPDATIGSLVATVEPPPPPPYTPQMFTAVTTGFFVPNHMVFTAVSSTEFYFETNNFDPWIFFQPLTNVLPDAATLLCFDYKSEQTMQTGMQIYFSSHGGDIEQNDVNSIRPPAANPLPPAADWTKVELDLEPMIKDLGWGTKTGVHYLRIDFGEFAGYTMHIRNIHIGLKTN